MVCDVDEVGELWLAYAARLSVANSRAEREERRLKWSAFVAAEININEISIESAEGKLSAIEIIGCVCRK
jgi:hypothetical protein